MSVGGKGTMAEELGIELGSATKLREVWLQSALLLLVDLAVVVVSFLIAYYVRRNAPYLPTLANDLAGMLQVWPAILVWPLVMYREDLYPGFQWVGGEYLRRIVTATTTASLILMAATFVTKTGPQYSRSLLVGFWLVTLITLPTSRFVMKRVLDRMGFGGPRAVVLGAGQSACLIMEGLRAQNPPSYRPVAIFDDDPAKQGGQVGGVPVLGPVSEAQEWARHHGIQVAIVAMPGVARARLIEIIEAHSRGFPRLLILPNLFGLSTVEVGTRDVGGTLTLEMRKNLLYLHNRVLKRFTDYLLVFLLGMLSLPLTAVIGLATLLDSGRPVFFQQERVGRGADLFNMWKFRTMVQGADEVLADHLERDKEARQEWQQRQKLTNDPRLTTVGRFLRRLSLDELPQLWNILRGQMSLVGPRPITKDQIELYGESFHLYAQVRPGLTGLWQVEGRAETSFQQRVEHDTYYIRNWSIWLDAIIIARTFWAVLNGRGAY